MIAVPVVLLVLGIRRRFRPAIVLGLLSALITAGASPIDSTFARCGWCLSAEARGSSARG